MSFSFEVESYRNQYSVPDQNYSSEFVPSFTNVTSFSSNVEETIMNSQVPIIIDESEEVTINGEKGIWANKQEILNWKGSMPISEYKINEDPNPEVIVKQAKQEIEYIQEMAIRYLKPPTPAPPGDIIIQQESSLLAPPAPPLIIRQQPLRPETPEPLIIREAPPPAPVPIGRKVIHISGKNIPPPPRKVVIERLAPLPEKPQPILIERWLPYSKQKRRVILKKTSEQDPVLIKPKNIIIQWEAPKVVVKQNLQYLGTIVADPIKYVQKFGSELKQSDQLPDFVKTINTPQGIVLACEYQYNQVHELEGDLEALKMVDLDKEGLQEYKNQLGLFY